MLISESDGHIANAGGGGQSPVSGGELLVAGADVDERAQVRRERPGASGVDGTEDDDGANEARGCIGRAELGGRELVRGDEDARHCAIEGPICRQPLSAVGQYARRRCDETQATLG